MVFCVFATNSDYYLGHRPFFRKTYLVYFSVVLARLNFCLLQCTISKRRYPARWFICPKPLPHIIYKIGNVQELAGKDVQGLFLHQQYLKLL